MVVVSYAFRPNPLLSYGMCQETKEVFIFITGFCFCFSEVSLVVFPQNYHQAATVVFCIASCAFYILLMASFTHVTFYLCGYALWEL